LRSFNREDMHTYIMARMSHITLDWKFFEYNDLYIFLFNELFFGESTHPSSQISAYQTSLRLSDRPQCHLGEPVLMYEHRHYTCRPHLCVSTERSSRSESIR
jgi:hypothetical protein